MLEKMIGIGPVDHSFKNKGTAKTRPLPLAPILLVQNPVKVGEAGAGMTAATDRDLQRKSKLELGVLRQDPPTLKSVLCFNRNGVLERKFWQSFEIELSAFRRTYLGGPYL